MPDLPDVEQTFTADATEYLAALDDMIAKASELAGLVDAAAQSMTEMGVDAGNAAVMIGAAADRANDLASAAMNAGTATSTAASGIGDASTAAAELAAGASAASESFADLSRTAEYLNATFGIYAQATKVVLASSAELFAMNESLAESFGNVASSAQVAALSEAELAAMNERLGLSSASAAAIYATLQNQILRGQVLYGQEVGSLSIVSNGYSRLADAQDAAGASASRTYGWWRLTGNAIHWIVMGTLEIASTAVPALIAFGSAAVAMYPTFDGLYDHFNNLVTAAGGIRGALAASGGPLSAFAAGMGQVEQAVQPDAFIITGSAIQILTEHTGVFAGMAQQASNVLADFATKLVADLQGPAGTALSGFFTNAVKYMIQWGQFLGNLGHTFINVVNSMWGVGQLLLDVLDLISRALLDITSNPVGAFFIGLAAAMSAAYRYGQLLVTIFNWLGGSALVSGIKNMIPALAAWASNLLAIRSAADLAAFAQMTLDTLMTPLGIAVGAIAVGLGIWYLASRQTTDATTELIKQVQSAPVTVNNLADGIITLSNAIAPAQQRVADLTQKMDLNARSAGYFAYEQQQAAGDVAKLEKAIGQQAQKLVALETSLTSLGLTNGQVAASMSVLSIQTELQDSKVQALNQAWDAYLSLITGGTSGLAAMATSMQSMLQVTTGTGANLTTTTDTIQQFQQALAQGPMGAQGAAAWTSFDSLLNQTQTGVSDWAQTAVTAGALTKGQFSQAIADAGEIMLQYAGSNKVADAAISAFVQRGGPAAVSEYNQLSQSQNGVATATSSLTGIINTGSLAMSNASQIAQNMSSVLNSQMTGAIAAAALKTSGFNTDIQNMIQAQQNNTTVGGKTWQQWAALAQQAMQQAQTNAASAAANINKSLNSIPSTKVITFILNTVGSVPNLPGAGGAGVAGGGGHTQSGYGASGGLIGGIGTGTSDSNLIRASRGEFMMSEAAVSYWGTTMMHAMNAKGHASGGVVGSPGLVPQVLEASLTGGGGDVHLNHASQVNVHVGGRRMLSEIRSQQLTFERRNSGTGLNLGRQGTPR